MQAQIQQQRLAALRDVIADIERKPVLAEARQQVAFGADGAFPALGGGLVQEVFTDAARNGGASLAFALGQGRGLLTAKRPALLYLQLAQDSGFFGLPYGPGLLSFGLDPARLIIVRPRDMAELLWASEEALTSGAVAGIVAEIGAVPQPLDFTASRRLGLRAAEAGTSLFLLRYGQAREPSAAHLRWHLAPERSGRKRHDAGAPGAPRWRLMLERGTTIKRQGMWRLEWTENGFATLPARQQEPQRHAHGAPLSRAVPALLGDRLSQTA
jgi:protein ImuA